VIRGASEVLNGLDLFSGIGGLTIALSEWVRPIAYCENDRFAQAVLLSRMSNMDLPRAPIWDDVRTLKSDFIPKPEIIYGGFPCQDISVAGDAKGMVGKRSGLFQDIARLTQEIRPAFVFLENVPAITTRGLDVVLAAFTQLRYDCRWTVVSARDVGAPHLRKRWFFLAANSECFGIYKQSGRSSGKSRKNKIQLDGYGKEELVAHTVDLRYEKQERYFKSPTTEHTAMRSSWWEVEPSICRVVDELQNRSHRIKALGNSVVPMQAREAFMRLMGLTTPSGQGTSDSRGEE